MDFNKMEYFKPAEDLVRVLKNKNQSNEDLFFRVLVGYYFSKVASIMRAEVVTLDRGSIPTNMYALNLAVSGFGKGKSVNIIEDEILDGFKTKFMESTLPEIADFNIMTLARARSTKAGTDPDIMYKDIKKEYQATGAYLFNFDSGTGPAIKQLRHQLLLAGAGSINLEMDEVGANFSNNVEVLNTFIELYDVGKVKPKITKNTIENKRNEAIEGRTPTNMLLFGTPSKLLDGGRSEQDFYSMLDMGYARRLLFSYVDKIDKKKGLTPEEIFDLMTDTSTDLYIKDLHDRLEKLADRTNYGKTIEVDKDVTLEIIRYEQYCLERSAKLKDHQDMQKAELNHRYFRAIKLAGTYAWIDGSSYLRIEHLHAAIKLIEDSGESFGKLLKREKPYVKLAKYVADLGTEVTQVDMVEDLPFYKGSESQKKDLLNLAIAYGYKNNIIIKKSYVDGIEFIKGESLKENDMTKLIVGYSSDITTGYVNEFGKGMADLKKLINEPGLHFTAHHWKDGYRNKANVVQGFNLVILDVDKDVSISTAQELLKDYEHLIYTTKRHTEANNRFRIILPLSHELHLSPDDYSKFMENVFEWLPFEIDSGTKDIARKWQTHPGEVYENNGKLLESMNFIPQTKKAHEMSNARHEISNMSNLESWFYREIGEGSRNNVIFRYGAALMNNGYDLTSVRNAVVAFNNKLKDKLTDEEIHSTVMVTITKKFTERELKES